MLRISDAAYAVILQHKHQMEETRNRSISMTKATDDLISTLFDWVLEKAAHKEPG